MASADNYPTGVRRAMTRIGGDPDVHGYAAWFAPFLGLMADGVLMWPHRGIDLRTPRGDHPRAALPLSLMDIGRRDVLGGLIHEYSVAA